MKFHTRILGSKVTVDGLCLCCHLRFGIPEMLSWMKRFFKHDEARIPLILAVSRDLTLNVEPLAQTWIRCENLYSKGHYGLKSPKRIQNSHALRGVGYEPEARAGLNRST